MSLAAGCGTIIDAPGVGGDGGIDAAIGDGSVDATPDPCLADDISFELLKTCFPAALCHFASECVGVFSAQDCESPETLQGLFGTTFDRDFRRFASAIEAGTMSFDSEKAAECLAIYRGDDCGQIENFESVDSPCAAMFVGNVAATGDCYLNEECASGFECDIGVCEVGFQCCLGKCQALPVRGALGVVCNGDDTCQPGLKCAVNALDPDGDDICQPGNTGSPCNSSSDCKSDFFCTGNYSTPGECQPRFSELESCGADQQCPALLACVGNDVPAAGNQGFCRTVDAEGDLCDTSCRGALFCKRDQPLMFGTCSLLPLLGESCADSYRCRDASLYCDESKICKLKVAVNQDCTDDEQCQTGLYCVVSTCLPPQASGLSCQVAGNAYGDDDYCASGVCNDATVQCNDQVDCWGP